MDVFFKNVALLAISFVIIYGFYKLSEYYGLKYSGLHESKKVYKAAYKFAHGATSDEVKDLLTSCFEFDKEDADEILMQSLPHREDNDGGYREFIKSVNRVLNMDIYSEQYHDH